MSVRYFIMGGIAGVVWIAASRVSAAPVSPTYLVTFSDAVTGDAPNPQVASDGKRRWTIDAGADSYQNDYYERPTVQTYEVYNLQGGGQVFAAKEYFEYLDIVEAKAGYDGQYLYISIDLFGRDKHTEDNVQSVVGLIERYGFRLGKNTGDPESAGGVLLVSDQPELKNLPNTTYAQLGTFGYRDTNNDVGGTGISVTKEDVGSEVNGNGYDQQIISDGKFINGPNNGADAMWVRIDPGDNTIVEFAVDYGLLGFSQADLQNLGYLEIEAIKGGPKDPQNYLWNDEYNKSEAGSPYRATSGDTSKSEFGTQGLGNIYELDTLRGGSIPEPAMMGLAMLSLAALGRGRR